MQERFLKNMVKHIDGLNGEEEFKALKIVNMERQMRNLKWFGLGVGIVLVILVFLALFIVI